MEGCCALNSHLRLFHCMEKNLLSKQTNSWHLNVANSWNLNAELRSAGIYN